MPKVSFDNISGIYTASTGKKIELPFSQSKVSAGFPSPADDYMESRLDLNEYLIKHPAATFFVKAIGNSMIKAGIDTGDVLVVDRSLDASDGKIVIAVLNSEFTIKRLSIRSGNYFLVPENDEYKEIEVSKEDQFEIWGVITAIIKEAI